MRYWVEEFWVWGLMYKCRVLGDWVEEFWGLGFALKQHWAFGVEGLGFRVRGLGSWLGTAFWDFRTLGSELHSI